MSAPETRQRFMGWLPFATLVLSILGLADSGYQTYTHFTDSGLLGCSGSSDACVAVQSSQYAWLLGIPVAVFGVVFYAFMVAICLPWAWRATAPVVHQARLLASITGMLFVLYLVYTEIVRIGRICPYCTSVHIITLLLFALIVYQAPARRQELAQSLTRRSPWHACGPQPTDDITPAGPSPEPTPPSCR